MSAHHAISCYCCSSVFFHVLDVFLTHLFTTFNCSLSYVNGFLVQRTADERTAKAVELEQKVALLEVDNNNYFRFFWWFCFHTCDKVLAPTAIRSNVLLWIKSCKIWKLVLAADKRSLLKKLIKWFRYYKLPNNTDPRSFKFLLAFKFLPVYVLITYTRLLSTPDVCTTHIHLIWIK